MELFRVDRKIVERCRNARAGADRIDLVGVWGKSRHLDAVAAEQGGALVVRATRHIDAAQHLVLQIAEGISVEGAAAVAEHLQRSPADPRPALHRLEQCLGGRRLLVDDVDLLRRHGRPYELPSVLEEVSTRVHDWVLAHAALTTRSFSDEGEHHVVTLPDLEVTHGHGWGADVLWHRVGRDPELYALAVTHQLLHGEALGAVPRDPRQLASELFELLGADTRSLIELLVVHGRAIAGETLRDLFPELSRAVVHAGDVGLVEVRRGELSLARPWHEAQLVSHGHRRALHEKLALGFERIAHDGENPMAVLEAHRHFAAIPDVDRARQTARFGVTWLLDLGRRRSIDAKESGEPTRTERFRQAATAYGACLDLDGSVGASGIGRLARAYARHYCAYNRYKAQDDTIDATLEAYRVALGDWPQNALFWSRYAAGLGHAGRLRPAVAAIREAYSPGHVPEHTERDAYLRWRTARKLLEAGRPWAAALVYESCPAGAKRDPALERQLDDALLRVREVRELWGGEHLLVPLRSPLPCHVEPRGTEVSASVGPFAAHAVRAFDAIRSAMAHAVASIARPGDPAHLKDVLAAIDDDTLCKGNEDARWLALLVELARGVAAGRTDARQRDAFIRFWATAIERDPALTRPLVTFRDDQLHASFTWAGRRDSFTLEIRPDGRLEWFYGSPGQAPRGTEGEPESELPDVAWGFLGAMHR